LAVVGALFQDLAFTEVYLEQIKTEKLASFANAHVSFTVRRRLEEGTMFLIVNGEWAVLCWCYPCIF
jgi:hypothetical protein